MADSGGFEIAKAYVTIIPSFKDGQTTIRKELGYRQCIERGRREVGQVIWRRYG